MKIIIVLSVLLLIVFISYLIAYFSVSDTKFRIVKYTKKDYIKREPRKNQQLLHIIWDHLAIADPYLRDDMFYTICDIIDTISTKLQAGEIIEMYAGENYDQKQLKIHNYPPDEYFIFNDLINQGCLDEKMKLYYQNEMKKIQQSL